MHTRTNRLLRKRISDGFERNIRSSRLLVCASQEPIYELGKGLSPNGDCVSDEWWQFTAYRLTGEVVFKQVIVAPEDDCGVLFLEALAHFLTSRGGALEEIATNNARVFCVTRFSSACKELKVIHHQRQEWTLDSLSLANS
jgi:hypothetical protein